MTAELVVRWTGGELDLMGWNDSPDGDFRIDALADGTDWGNPEAVRRTLRRFLLDGSTTVKEYDNNRSIPLSLRVTGADGAALAAGEKALDLIDGRRCELVWTPPSVFSAPAVFVIDYADLRHKMDDIAEMRDQPERFYTLTLSAGPHAYSDEWIEVQALPQSISPRTEFDTCDSLTGWSASGMTLQDGGDRVYVEYPAGVLTGSVRRDGLVNFTADRYLAATYDFSGCVGGLVRVYRNNDGGWVECPRIGTDNGAVLYDVGISVSSLAWEFELPPDWQTGSPWNWPAVKIVSLGKQATTRSTAANDATRTIAVPGSRRSPASVLVEMPSPDTLGDLVVYSGPEYDPSLEARLAEGDHGVYGSLYPGLSDTALYKVPVSELPPGDYVCWADVTAFSVEPSGGGAGTTGTLEVTAELHAPNDGGVLREVALNGAPVGDWTLGWETGVRAMFAETLPPWDLPTGSSHELGLRVTLPADLDGKVEWTTLWLFNTTLGNLTVVRAGSARKAWIDPATLDRDHPSVLVGSDDKSSAIPCSLASELPAWSGAHHVSPGVANLYSWASNAGGAEVSALFRPAWHTHPAS